MKNRPDFEVAKNKKKRFTKLIITTSQYVYTTYLLSVFFSNV